MSDGKTHLNSTIVSNQILKSPSQRSKNLELSEKLDPSFQVASLIKHHVDSFVKLATTRVSETTTDNALPPLLAKINQVTATMADMQKSTDFSSVVKIYGQMARQILECTDFIIYYSETKNFWKRVGKYVSEETYATIKKYNDVLDNLSKDFQDQTTRDIELYRIFGDLDPSDMVYAAGAGLVVSKCCLPDTRKETLSKIKNWVCNEGEPCIMWLSGDEYTGKSAIAHTITKWYTELGGLGACFCFDRTRGADRRYEKMFPTIAHDLAKCDPFVRRVLADAFHDDNTLKHTTDIKKQWRELIIGPVNKARGAFVFPLLIVIDGWNESDEENSPEQFLRLLSGGTHTPSSKPIPKNYRILITSRRPKHIPDTPDTVPHVTRIPLDVATEYDIRVYLSIKLPDLWPKLDDEHVKKLFHKSGGLFEWVSLACKYINGAIKVDQKPMTRFEHVVQVDETHGKDTHTFDFIYRLILEDMIPKDNRREFTSRFCSVMKQILASQEPLPIVALNAMRQQFPNVDDHYDVASVVGSLDSLLIGTSKDSQTPICPVHPSFYDFLRYEFPTVSSRSQNSFVNVPESQVQHDLAFASLRVMEDGLHFNICSLESSYLPNSAVTDLETRVEKCISAELSYSCRFWSTHVQATAFESLLAKKVQGFFNGECLLFWLEALALMKSFDSLEGSLSSIIDWFKQGGGKYTQTGDVSDTQEFVRKSGTTILRSTPHLYLSALPFAPQESAVYKTFDKYFPGTARVISGHVTRPPQTLLGGANVMSVAVSSTGKRIVCGLDDGKIRVWDRVTGEEFNPRAPPKGHSGAVRSVAISTDGELIVSGSNDETVQVWNAESNKEEFTFKGHSGAVRSVVVSSDKKHVVSGSDDKTVRMWDLKDGKALGAPLQGHTAFVQSVQLNGDRIISGSADNTIRIWDVETRKELRTLQGHTDWVQSVALSYSGHLIVSGSRDKTIRVWNAETGESYCAPLQGHIDDVLSVAISLDEKHIVSGSADNTVLVWDVESGGVFRAPLQLGKHVDYVRSVAISPDGQYVASGSDDETIQVWSNALQTPASFSSDLASILSSVSTVLPESRKLVSLKDGWIIDQEGQLLLWIPPDRHPSVTNNMLLISDGSLRLDLKKFVHGPSWGSCWKKENIP